MRALAKGLILLNIGCASGEATPPPATPAPEPASASPVSDSDVPPATEATSPQPAAPEAPQGHQHGEHQHGEHQHGEHQHGEHQHGEHQHGAGYEMSFADVERFAKHFDDPARDAWQKPQEVLRHLGAKPGQTLADIGAGTGYFLPYLSRAAGATGKVLALDVETQMVDYMKQRVAKAKLPNVEAKAVSPSDPGLPTASVDHVLIVNTWHHIGARPDYSAKLARALRPSGSVLIVDFTLDSDIGPPAKHRLPPAEVVKELELGGLKASIVAEETLPKQYLVRGVKR